MSIANYRSGLTGILARGRTGYGLVPNHLMDHLLNPTDSPMSYPE